MKRVCVLLILLLFSVTFVYAQEKDVEEYAETAGEGLLKFQELVLSALSFISFGAMDGGAFGFIQFLFMILLFMIIYSIITFIPFVSGGLQFPIALIISILSFMWMDVVTIQAILLNYEAMGVTITVILPVLILLAFTFRIYQKAYEGESEKSPFYARVFNLIFLIFFGIFFIRYSFTEGGVISIMRFWSGCVLIGIGVGQFIFIYKIFAIMISKYKKDAKKEQIRRRGIKQELVDEMKEKEFESMKD